DVVLWAGPRTHFVHYPLRRGELYNLVAVFHSDHYEEGWNAEGSKDVMWQHFKMQVPQVLRMLEGSETWGMWLLCDAEPVKNWSSGRVTLLGDAAHPMLQYLAQGACMATEDAVVLAEKVAATPDDPARAFAAYEQERYLRTGRTQIMARVYGEFYHARGVAAELRGLALSPRTPGQSYHGIAWRYGGPEYASIKGVERRNNPESSQPGSGTAAPSARAGLTEKPTLPAGADVQRADLGSHSRRRNRKANWCRRRLRASKYWRW